MALLEERQEPSVVLKAMGKAINKAVVVGTWRRVGLQSACLSLR